MSWIKARTTPETLKFLGTVSEKCAELGGPLSKHLNKMFQSGDYAQLIEYSIDYSTVELQDAVYARQILALIQKYEYLDLGLDKAVTAALRFADSEIRCLQTNRTLAYHRRKPHLVDSFVSGVFHAAQRKISDILGPVPSLEVLTPSFGSGANTNVKSTLANPRAKLGVEFECSYEMAPYLSEYLYEVPAWVALHSHTDLEETWVSDVALSPGKLSFVPKNAKTHRSIVVEPILNSFFQKGFGHYLKGRLLRSGIDLSDQQRNRTLACRGSVDGSLATVDLSMASDCLSVELVWELLPYDWADRLSQLRTGSVLLPKPLSSLILAQINGVGSDTACSAQEDASSRTLRLEKFSSMGNGFTFELESLIFFGLAWGVCKQMNIPITDVSVYGDDIIIPTAAYSRLVEVLDYCGFSVNTEKSFYSGPFRESCGADYLEGFDIRPFYLKSQVSERVLFTMHNYFIRNGERELAKLVEQECNPVYRIYGPDGFGDGHLIGTHVLNYSRPIRRNGWGGGTFDTYTLKTVSFTKQLPGDSVLPAYSVYIRSGQDSATDPNIVRGSRGYSKISIYTLSTSIFSRV